MFRLSLVLNLALAGAVATLVYLFVLSGRTGPADDGRIAILLSPDERDFMLADMRGLLETVQQASDAIGRNDMTALAAAARQAGRAGHQEPPFTLLAKLPIDFKLIGPTMHDGFDQLAAGAGTGLGPQQATAALAGILSICAGCHAGYRFDLETAK
ncbi:MAG: hypothetical protein WAT70_01900 [Rhizobiaceae bacterium]